MKKSDKALVGFKPCPRCHGTGRIPCDGKEVYRERHRVWAEGFVGKVVAIKNYNFHNREFVWIPGVATGVRNAPGGWPHVVVHVVKSKLPVAAGWRPALIQDLTSFEENGYDEIHGKAFWFDLVGEPERIKIISETPELLQLKDQLRSLEVTTADVRYKCSKPVMACICSKRVG